MQAAAARVLAESVHAGYVQDAVLRSLRVPSPQTHRLEDDPQIKAFIADFFAPEMRGLDSTSRPRFPF